jgi:hypothetical protein
MSFFWQYGTCNGSPARRHRFKRNVQFVRFKAVHEDSQGFHNTRGVWMDFNSYWWPQFKAAASHADMKDGV